MTAGEATRAVPRGAGISWQEKTKELAIGNAYTKRCDVAFFFVLQGTYSDGDGTALSALLGGERVRKTKVGTPVSSSHGDDAELRDDDGSTDSGRDFLRRLDTETDVALGVANDDDGLEAGSLTGTGLLLDGLDL